MAILPILFGMLFILFFILLFVFFAGLAMFIVGLVTKIKAKSQNRKRIYPNVLLGLSIPIMLVPLLFILLFAVGFYFEITKPSDHVIFNEKIEEFFDAADNNDKQAIYDLFSKSAQDSELEEQIEEFLEVYPAHPDIEYTESVGGGSSTVDGTEELMSQFVFSKDGEDYYCYMNYIIENYENPEEIGINLLVIESPEVYCDDSVMNPDDSGFYVNLSKDYDYETVRIDGYPHIYTSYDRTITEEQMIEFFKSNVDFTDFKNKFGEPNANESDLWLYYELQSVNGEKRYLCIYVQEYNNAITSATVEDDVGEYFDEILDEATALEIWEKCI